MKKSVYLKLIITTILVSLFLYTVIISAWISDDSLITLTQIVNLHHGDGLVFNFGERVQAFTHPTWFLLLSILTYITGDYYYTILAVSIILSLSAVLLLIYYSYREGSLDSAIFTITLLLFSKAFIDYSTSGLENPLSYFLFAGILYIIFSYEILSQKQLYLIYLLFSLLFLNRMDYALILAPIVLVLLFKYKSLNLKPMLLSISIVVAWFIFALFYFGHIFPNTYYAKLKAGYPIEEFLERGLNYFEYQFDSDPITLIIIIFGVFAGLYRKGFARAVAIGLVIYLLYILKIGGDFMQGRFFAVPVIVSAFLIINFLATIKDYRWIYILLIPIIYFGSSESSPLFVGKDYNNQGAYKGIADERGFYFQMYGLIAPHREWPKIAKLDKKPTIAKSACGGLGAEALSSRDKVFYIDICALTDPLLSQLPAIKKSNWRIGHEERKVPTDYSYTVLNDISLYDNSLNRLYRDIKSVSHGDLWSFDRLKAIYRINRKDYHIDRDRYSSPKIALPLYSQSVIAKLYPQYLNKIPPKRVKADEISKEHRVGMRWDGEGAKLFSDKGIAIEFKKSKKIKSLSIGFDNNDKYLVILLNGDKIKDLIIFPKSYGIGIQNRAVTLDREVEIDRIYIFPLQGDGYYSLGWLSYH